MSFANYIECESILTQEKLTELINLLDIETKDDVPSHVYNRIDQTNVINKHLRSSRKIEYIDDQLFDWVEQNIVISINENYQNHQFVLIRNDLEVIKYGPGDYFKKHQDFINIDSNEFKNYTFIVGLKCCEKGGQTVFYINETRELSTILTDSPGNMIIFRKDLIHEGLEVIEGNKYILKGNFICLPQKSIAYCILVIIFPSNQTYLLETSKLTGSIYETFIDFEKTKTPDKKIFFYYEDHLNEVDFLTLYNNIYNNQNFDSHQRLIKMNDYTQLKYIDKDYLFKFNNFINFGNLNQIILFKIDDYYQ